MKIKAYLCCDETGCEAKELVEICVAFEDNKPVIGCSDVPDGWEYLPPATSYSRNGWSPEEYYCPAHRRSL